LIIRRRPDDGNAVPGKRQVSKYAVVAEPLEGCIAMRFLRRKIGDHALFSVRRIDGYQAGRLPNPGIPAVGTDQQTR